MANLSNINNKFLVTTGGNVGINSTSPIQKLDTPNIVIGGSTIAGTFRANAVFIDNNGGNSRFYSSGADGSTKGSYEFNIMASDGNPLETPLVVNSSGNVGIGSLNPYAFDTTATKLHVKNPGSSGSVVEVARFEGSPDASGSGGTIRLGTSNDRGIYFEGGRTATVPYGKIGLTEYNGAKTPIISLFHDSATNFSGNVTANGIYTAGNSVIIYKAQRNGGAVAGDWSYDDATTDMSLGTSTAHSFSLKTGNTRALTINSSQNVGIGTASPNEKLQLAGNLNAYAPGGIDAGLFASTAAGSTTIALRSSGVTHFNGGNVGIGTTSPQRPLHVNGTEGVARFTSTASGNNGFEVGIGVSSQAFLWLAENSHMEFATNNIERMRINPDGTTKFNANILVDVINNAANSANIIYRSGTNTIIGGGTASQKLTIADSGTRNFFKQCLYCRR
jgi:hypothetical protein